MEPPTTDFPLFAWLSGWQLEGGGGGREGEDIGILRPMPIRPSTSKDEEKVEVEERRRREERRDETVSPATRGTKPPANRMSYPREFKLMVIDSFHQKGRNKYQTCKRFKITKSMLNGWLSKVDRIRESKPGSLKSGRSGRKPQFPSIEKRLHEKYLEHSQQGDGLLGNHWLRQTAKRLAEDSGCQVSERWLDNFKKRFGLEGTKENADGREEGELRLGDDLGTEKPLQAFYDKYPWLCRKLMEPRKRGRKVQFPEVEEVLIKEVMERQRRGERVSNRWIQQEARRLASSLSPSSPPRCLFSEHWLHNFKKRHGVSLLQPSSSPSPTTSNSGNSPPNDVLELQSWLVNQYRAATVVGSQPGVLGGLPTTLVGIHS